MSSSLEDGRAALGRGDWQSARLAFDASIQAGEQPEALEGLALAAWWLDLADVVFDARTRLPPLSRARRQPRRRAHGDLARLGHRGVPRRAGDRQRRKTGMPLGPGGLALMPARANHAAYAKGKMTVFPFGQGPIEFTYVSTSDDSRSKTSTSRK